MAKCIHGHCGGDQNEFVESFELQRRSAKRRDFNGPRSCRKSHDKSRFGTFLLGLVDVLRNLDHQKYRLTLHAIEYVCSKSISSGDALGWVGTSNFVGTGSYRPVGRNDHNSKFGRLLHGVGERILCTKTIAILLLLLLLIGVIHTT